MTPENLRECLTPVVGLSATDYPCADSLPPEGATDSLSGFYLTDNKDGIPVQFVGGISDCNAGGIWDILSAARADGVKNFVADLLAEFGNKYRPRWQDFSGYIGKQDASTAVTNAKTYAAFELKGKQIQSSLRVKGFKMYSGLSGDVDVSLYSEDDLTTPLETVTVTTVARKWTSASFTEMHVFDLWDENTEDPKRYFLVWEIPDGDYPRQNATTCCNRSESYRNFLEVRGLSVDNIEDLTATDSSLRTHSDIGMGISVDVSLSCTVGNYLCGCLNFGMETFSTTGIQWIIAKTLQHSGVMCLSDIFVKSQNINTYTLLAREVVYGIRAHAQKEYLQGVRYIAENLPEGALQCFECRDHRMMTRTLLA